MNTSQWEIDRQSQNPPKVLDRSFETTRKYAEAVVDVGKRENLPIVDVWNLLYDAAGKKESALENFLVDGLHLNTAGYEVGLIVSALKIVSHDICVLSFADCVRSSHRYHKQ